MMIVFEPELWGVSPLIPDGKMPTFKPASTSASGGSASATSTGKSSGKSNDGLKLWDGGSFDFHDILDVINPLQHLPVVSSIYRSEVKDEIGAVPRLLGSMLYGGGVVGALIGAASAIVNIVVEHETGKDLGQHIYTAIFGDGDGTRRTTHVAASRLGKLSDEAAGVARPTELMPGETVPGETKSAEAKSTKAKSTEAKPAIAAATGHPTTAAAGKPAATSAAATSAAATSAGATGAKPLSAKANAALQAFVAGLAKNASPAAAAAANATIAKRALRVTGTAAAGAVGKSTSGAPTRATISTQVRRADWYQHNQASLKAQAAALAKRNAAASAAKSGGNDAKSNAAILHLFTHPNVTLGKSAKPAATKTATPAAAPAKPAAAKSTAGKSTVGTAAAGKSTANKRGAVAGPWVVNEIASGLAKYEALVKARKVEPTAK
jgi:hypothetical protein